MMQKRRLHRLRRTLNVEALEDRMLLSGVVYAGIDPSTNMLNITGDGGNNAITIQTVQPNVLRISGGVSLPTLSSPPDVTSVDGVTFRQYLLDTISGISIQMLNGNNQVAMSGFGVPGNITINAGSGHDTFSFDSIQTNVGSINITATGLGADTVTLNNVVAGTATIGAGAGVDSISLDNVAIGVVDISTANSTANNTITVADSVGDSTRPGIGQLTILSGDGKNTIGVTNTTLLKASVTAGNGNNTISVDGSTMLSGRITAGTGSNAIEVSNDTIGGPAGLALNVGVGGSAVQTIRMMNDTFSGGALNVSVGDGVPYYSPDPAPTGSLLKASFITMMNDVGIGIAQIKLGKFLASVTSYISAGSVTLSVGDNADLVRINNNTSHDENITIGNPATYPIPPLPVPAITIGGAVGTSGFAQNLQVQVGDGWQVSVDAGVSGNANIKTGNSDTISVSSPGIGGDLTLTTGNDAPSIAVMDTTSNNLTIQAGTGSTYFYLNNDTVNNALNFTAGDGDSSLALLNINVLFSLFVTFSAGNHVLVAQNTTCLFGEIDGGSGSANTYEDLGGNFGFFVTGVSGVVGGPFPPIFDASNLSLDANTINQGDTATLTGTFTQLGITDSHTVTINWGDGSEPTQILLDPGVYSFSAPHQYFDDNTDGTPAIVDQIAVTVTNSIGDSANATTPITVNDVPPVIPPGGLQLSASTINAGDSLSLTGSLVNPGPYDTNQVVIDWGDSSTPTTLHLDPGINTFGPVNHIYQQGLPGGAPYTIHATVSDEGNASTSTTIQATVINVAPSNLALGVSEAVLNEGDTTTLNGTFAPGALGTDTVVITWGDGSTNTTLSLAAGVAAFSADHQYLQNLPGNAPYTIQATVSDKNNAGTSASRMVTVSNVSPANLNLNFANAPVNEGDTATLNGSFTDPGVLDTHIVVINWGDGSANTTLSLDAGVLNFHANHPYLDNLSGNAPYTVLVTVSDDDNASDSLATQLIVNNVAPANVALSFANASVNAGDTATLNGTFTDPGVLDTHMVVIDWGDGSLDTTLSLDANVKSFTAGHRYQQALPGNAPYAVQATVVDKDDASSSGSTQLIVNNVLPTNLTLSLASDVLNEGDTATLSGTITAPSLLNHAVIINWGDGSANTTLSLGAGVASFNANHPYEDVLPGNAPFTIQVTASDQNNTSLSASTQLTVTNVPPANINLSFANSTISVGDTATLNGTFTDPALLDTHTVVINWGDGSANTTLNLDANVLAFSAKHPYSNSSPGGAPYSVEVTISDEDNATASASTLLLVNIVAPIANPGPVTPIVSAGSDLTVAEETAVTLNGTFTDSNTDSGHTLQWTVVSSNGQVLPAGNSSSYGFTPSDDGTYTATFTVTDSNGSVGTSKVTVTATRVPPTLMISGVASVNAGSVYTLNLNGRETGADTIMSWTVTWGDGTVQTLTGNPSSATHVYATRNSYTVSAQATDEDGTYNAANTVALNVAGVTPSFALSGPATGSPLSPYTLNLTSSNAPTVTSWTINWGDGTIQPVNGNPSSATHTYPLVHRSYTISAQATDGHTTFAAGNTLTVNETFSSANENFVAQVYMDVLGRAADLGGLQSYTDRLSAGATRDQVVQSILSSQEYRTLVVEQLYQSYLGRTADAAGLNNDVQALAAGATTDQIKASVLGSNEYNQRSGGTSNGFVTALYHDLLGRTGSPSEIQGWVQSESAGVSRTALASLFIGSAEANQLLVQSFYRKYLHRSADLGGLNAFVQARESGATQESVIEAMVASDEYFKQAANS